MYLGVRPQNSQQIIEHRPPCMHDVDAQFRMPNERVLQRERAVQGRSVLRESEIRSTRRSGANVYAHGHIEFLGYGQIGFEARVTGRDPDILVRHLREYGQTPLGVKAAQRVRREFFATELELKAWDESVRRRLPPLLHPFRRSAQNPNNISALQYGDGLPHERIVGPG